MKRRNAGLPLAALVVVAAAGACSPRSNHHLTTEATVSQPVRTIELSSKAGHVHVRSAGEGDAITIHRRTDYQSGRTPHPGQEVRNGTLILTAGCSDCGTDYDLTVPASTGLVITDDSGEITLDGMAGAIDITSGSGAVRAVGLRSPSVRVRISAGPVDLGFATAPARITAHSSSGDVTATVPPGPYTIKALTKAGTRHINVPNTPSAANTITLSSDAGDVTVEAA